MKGPIHQLALNGMDDRVLPDPQTCLLLRDVEYDNTGAWQPVGGTFDITTFNAGIVTALYWFNPRGGQRWLFAERRVDAETSEIVVADWLSTGGARGRAVQVTTRRRLDSLQLGTQFAEYGGWLYLLSPVDSLIRTNGFRLSDVGFATPAAAPRVAGPYQSFDKLDAAACTFAAGVFTPPVDPGVTTRGVGPVPAGADASWLYGYAITTINDNSQESPPSPVVYANGVNRSGGLRQLVRVILPRQRKGIRGVRLWRTLNVKGVLTPGSSIALFLLEEFGSGAGVEYIDQTPDAELGRQLDPDQYGPVPQGARAIAFWQSAMWLGGMPGTPTTLQYSTALFVEQFPAINTLPIGTAATGPIVALLPMIRGLLVFKTGGVYMVKGNALDGYHIETLTEIEGCAAPQAVVQVPEFGVFFASAAGMRLVVGTMADDQPTRVIPVAQELSQFWRRKVGPNLRGARSVYDPERQEVWFAVPELGDPDPKNGIVFHTGLKRWSVRQGWPIGAMTHYRGRTFLGRNDGAGVHLLTRAVRTRFGAAYTASIYTNPLVVPETHLHRLELRGIAYGQAPTDQIAIATRVDKVLPAVQQHPGLATVRARYVPPRWGTATWNTSETWTDQELETFVVSVRTEIGTKYEVQLTLQPRARVYDLGLVTGDTKGPQPREVR